MALRMDRRGSPPLLLPGLVTFNCKTFGLRSEFRTVGDMRDGRLTTVLYINKRGRLVVPPNIPYTPIEFWVRPDMNARKRQSLWLELAKTLAREMKTLGVSGFLPLCPEISDVRPWQWRGFDAQFRYTFVLTFPNDRERRHVDIGRRVRQASRLGLVCSQQTDPAIVMECIAATERRQSFRYHLTEHDLNEARALLGDERLRMYTCHMPDGDVVSARVAICNPGAIAVGWIAGTCEVGLRNGASQHLMDFMLTDLEASGSTGIDLAGANLESIAYEKMNWGAELRSYPVLSTFGPRSIAVTSKRWFLSRKDI